MFGFVFNAEVEHAMFTDSSSGRQLAMRQGTGKVKHLSGKVLWIQDAVRHGVVHLSQIPTAWNVSSIGTKALCVQGTQLLRAATCGFKHALSHRWQSSTWLGWYRGVFDIADRLPVVVRFPAGPRVRLKNQRSDFCVVGMPEYESQCQRHGGERQMPKLVKQVAGILSLMGLESSISRGVTAASVLDDDMCSDSGMCAIEPNTQTSGGAGFHTLQWLLSSWW